MAHIMVGSIRVEIPMAETGNVVVQNTIKCLAKHVATAEQAQTVMQRRHATYTAWSSDLICSYDESINKAFASLEKACEERHAQLVPGTIVKMRRSYTVRKFTERERINFDARVAAANAERIWRASGGSSEIVKPEHHIYRKDGAQSVGFRSVYYTPTQKKTKKMTKVKHIELNEHQMNAFICKIIKIVRSKDRILEMRDSTRTKANFISFQARKQFVAPILTVQHMLGKRKKQDVHTSPLCEHICDLVAVRFELLKQLSFKPGDSGLIVQTKTIPIMINETHERNFIVRGKLGNRFVDARENIPFWKHKRLHEFAANQFWSGFERKFIQEKPKDINHICTSNFSVVKCGEVAALYTQALFPSGKITCRLCAEQFCNQSNEEIINETRKRMDHVIHLIDSEYHEFPHAKRFLTAYQSLTPCANPDESAFNKVFSIAGNHTQAPFVHLNVINKALYKGGRATEEEIIAAQTALVGIAQYLRNRTDSIVAGDLKHFRNKISSKTHYNADLMCDNQRDNNGNFSWGKRGEHAKRFFSTYFNKVDPSDGYGAFAVRKSKNGSRRTAIEKLIFSTNYEVFRDQMLGEPVPKMPLTRDCVSMRGKAFLYTCSCVTDEIGAPCESKFEFPTKHHVVIGNSGDAKYVELPRRDDNLMYIVQDGYCYIHIFLAMLINVSEDQAKEFTKWTRDNIIKKLGTWPTVLDVATSCNQLAILYPDTMCAELPRILVDHNTNSMHVLDSYGSISTGYHILKANTVAQFIQFAMNGVDSSMKAYTIGGRTKVHDLDHDNIIELIKSIYKPEKMRALMIEEPMLAIFAMLSPSVLIALFNSGSLEMAMQIWIHKNRDVAQIMSMLSVLATKTSCAQNICTQMQIIENSAGGILRVADRLHLPQKGISAAHLLLMRLEVAHESNAELDNAGYSIFRELASDLLEKIYVEELEAQWRELTWSAKLSQMWQSRKLRKRYTQFVPLKNVVDTRGKSRIFIKASLGKIRGCIVKKLEISRSIAVNFYYRSIGKLFCRLISSIRFVVSDLVKFVNILAVIQILLGIFWMMMHHTREFRRLKQDEKDAEVMTDLRQIDFCYDMAVKGSKDGEISEEEFIVYLQNHNSQLAKRFASIYGKEATCKFQAKSGEEIKLEKVIATMALILMIIDAERSDCLYKILNKLKNLMNTATQDSYNFQSIDDVQELLEEKKLTIDFEVDQESPLSNITGTTFEKWWANQLMCNNVIPHYRTEGHFMEFTRATASSVANSIAHGEHRDILLRGAVGSGKSTGLPFALSQKGRVLLIEPTKPLTENVYQHLKKDPFVLNPSMRMRGTTAFGSDPVMIMTSGYALHYYSNNAHLLSELDYIIIDECHVHDANAIAFRCCLKEHDFKGKILKVSATIPGRETDFTTQYPVKLLKEDALSFDQFAQNQKTGCNSDVTQHGDNILVYVASYNEVDQLSKFLIDRGFRVTKVDGRTMKTGQTSIVTKGTPSQQHFIVATNIIENGVTLDIDVVVDFGTKVLPELDVEARVIRYNKVAISYGERIQRLGRVGRHKEGTALKIGTTERGLQRVPPIVATEAAFLCFTYGFPVMTDGVSTSLLANCTVPQARTMQNFELTPFFTCALVRFDGSMHPMIHKLLQPYKLRDSEIILNKLAIPNASVKTWLTAREMSFHGIKLNLEDTVRMPFYAKDIPEKLITGIYDTTMKFRCDAGFGRITTFSASKIAYTLQTDPSSIQRTLAMIDNLIVHEQQKHDYFKSVMSSSASNQSMTLITIMNAVRQRHKKDHTFENIQVLQAAKNQILEFKNINVDVNMFEQYEDFGALECMTFQSEEQISKFLELKGHWNGSVITNDLLVVGGVLLGGAWMIYTYFCNRTKEAFEFQGNSKNSKRRYKFRQAYDNKHKFEIDADPDTTREYFGDAYLKKGTKGGTTRGMGAKTRRFCNMYGFDPTEYNFARYVDPLTGHTIDENPLTDLQLVSDHFLKVRRAYILSDQLEPQALYGNQTLEAYFVKNLAKQVLKLDLTPHNSMRVCDKIETISGFPDHEGELRQSGPATLISFDKLPKANEQLPDVVAEFESKSRFSGLRDYNPISSAICKLENDSDGVTSEIFGIGYGSLIITNQHLFRRNNGELRIRSHHGEFVVRNTTTLPMFPVEGRDILIIQLPKDCPPFPQKLKFREATNDERVCMVGTNFQTKSISSTISEMSSVVKFSNTNFFKHWITTYDGQCGLPLVSTKDGCIVGIHSLTNTNGGNNMYTSFSDNFQSSVLDSMNQIAWTKGWKLNLHLANWGPIRIIENQPTNLFKLAKDISEINEQKWNFQDKEAKWLYEQLQGNLKAVATTPANLVTKHVVKGKCPLFSLFVGTNTDAQEFFEPLMGAYQKSALNKAAYVKDVMKYAGPIYIGELNCEIFEDAVESFIRFLEQNSFHKVNYVTDYEEIFASLNMKAAVGAMYKGKKRDYFANFTDVEKQEIVKQSCERLFLGQMGIWNGSLKAELRPLEKVLANKTRSFTAAPIDTLLGGKVCVDDFNNQFYSRNLSLPWSVGMTKFYGGWDKLLCKLPDGWIYCDADGSRFDSSLSPYLINAVLKIRLHFMESWDIGAQMLQNFYTEIIYTPIATPDGTIVKKFKGNNSGQPSTVVDNTLMVILAMKYALLSLKTDEQEESFCKYFVNGDDLLLAVRPDCEFILDELKAKFAQLGLEYDFTSRLTDKSELWFMSHQGKRIDGMYIPKLEMERVVSILEWDRSEKPEHRLEAICASMIEAWGHPELLTWIRKFYLWVLEQAPYNELALIGAAPYISESALRALYTGVEAPSSELNWYLRHLDDISTEMEFNSDEWEFQSRDGLVDAGLEARKKKEEEERKEKEKEKNKDVAVQPDRDVNAGTSGTFTVPRPKAISEKMKLPRVGGKVILNLEHLLKYNPDQADISNTRSTNNQFATWYNGIRTELDMKDSEMEIILNGFMVWCIENGTSPNLNGVWTMMDGDEQVEYPLKVMLEYAKPTLRQIMAHFSNVAEAYIAKRNAVQLYIPRYARQRNLTDPSLAIYAFDFYEVTSKTPARAREAHHQMKAAALRGTQTRMFGLDGKVGTQVEDTERHTAHDVNRNMHTILGAQL